MKDDLLLNPEFLVQFHKEKRRNSVAEKLRILETLESKLCLNGRHERTVFSKQSTKLFSKHKPIRFDKLGVPILKKGSHKVTFSDKVSEIKVFHHKNTIFEDRFHEIKTNNDKVVKKVIKKDKTECNCKCVIF